MSRSGHLLQGGRVSGDETSHVLHSAADQLRLVAQLLLSSLRRVALLVQQPSNEKDDGDIALSIGAILATDTLGSQAGELGLPRTQGVWCQLRQFGHLTDAVVKFRAQRIAQ